MRREEEYVGTTVMVMDTPGNYGEEKEKKAEAEVDRNHQAGDF